MIFCNPPGKNTSSDLIDLLELTLLGQEMLNTNDIASYDRAPALARGMWLQAKGDLTVCRLIFYVLTVFK